MSSLASWPTSRAITRDDSDVDSDVEPKFERPEYFRRTSGKGGWYCSACTPSGEGHLHSFSGTGAMSHEKSRAHQDRVGRATSLEPTTANWGMTMGHWGTPISNLDWDGPLWGLALGTTLQPYDRLRESPLSHQVPLKKRVKRWMRDMAKAEGIEFEEEEDLDNDDVDLADWTQWGAGGDDWKRPQEEWGFPVGGIPPPANDETDPRATADFKFVEKVAKKRGLTKDRRRLHVFYRLPTDEKISRIQEIVQFIHSH